MKPAKDMKVYVALYNPMIHESAYTTLSIHKTRKGAEMAIEFHKNELREEHEDVYRRVPKEQRICDFDSFKDWAVEEYDVQD